MTPVGLLVGFAPTIMNLIVGPIRSAFIENGQGEFMAMRVLGLIAVVLGTICIMFIIKVKERVYEIETAPDGFEVKTDFSDVPPEGETAPPAAEEVAEGAASLAEEGAREGELTFEGMVASETPASAEEPFLGNAVPGGETAAAAAAAAPAMPARNKYQGVKDFFSLFKNKPLMILFFALIVGSLREFWVQFRPLILQLRYSADVTVALDIMGVANTVIGFASTVAMLLLPIVTRKLNKNVIIIVFSSLSLVVCGALGFVGIENIPQGTVSAVVLTLLFFIAQCNPTYLLIPVMLGEIADWQQARTGKRYEGHLQNFIFTIPGVFSQVAMLASWLWQNAIGFEPAQISNDISEAVGKIAEGAAIDPTTIVSAETHALANEWFNACFLLTAGSILLMIILLCFYPLTRKKHAELIAELESKATNLDELDENESVLAEDGSLVLKRTLTEGGEGGDEIHRDLARRVEPRHVLPPAHRHVRCRSRRCGLASGIPAGKRRRHQPDGTRQRKVGKLCRETHCEQPGLRRTHEHLHREPRRGTTRNGRPPQHETERRTDPIGGPDEHNSVPLLQHAERHEHSGVRRGAYRGVRQPTLCLL